MNLHKTHYGLINFNKITPAKFLINPSDLLQIELEMSFFSAVSGNQIYF